MTRDDLPMALFTSADALPAYNCDWMTRRNGSAKSSSPGYI